MLNSFMKNENLSISKVPRLSQNRPVQIGLKEPNVFASPFNWDKLSLKWPYQVPCIPMHLSLLMQDEPP